MRCSSWIVAVALLGVASARNRAGLAIERRQTLFLGAGLSFAGFVPPPARARTPGSTDVGEALDQIKDASDALKTLQSEWSSYACVDKEGRACNVDAARKVLGGVAPQRGDAAIEVAKRTPLYRIDGAFAAVRRYALEGDAAWADALDVEAFVEKGEEIAFALKKADDGFYGVVFASKGSTQLDKIYAEGKQSVDLAVRDFDQILTMLREAKAPGL